MWAIWEERKKGRTLKKKKRTDKVFKKRKEKRTEEP
jgi:hypothetical protein